MKHAKRACERCWTPRADIYETQEDVTVSLDLPGLQSEQIDIQSEKGLLSIKGERAFNSNSPERKYFRVENVYGPFERHFEIPSSLDAAQVAAMYKDGILSLTFPKKEEVKPQRIAINLN
jgi:HSP20 family protein